MARLDKLTIKSQEALAEALELAADKGHPELSGLHLLIALARQEQGAVGAILQRIGVSPAQVEQAALAALERTPRVSGTHGQPGLGHEAQQALDAGWKSAQNLKDEYLSTEHILLGLLSAKGDAARHGSLTFGMVKIHPKGGTARAAARAVVISLRCHNPLRRHRQALRSTS